MRTKRPKPRSSKRPKQIAKLFWTGRSQAVRLPKEFRFTGTQVLIRREGKKVVLEPDDGWPKGFFEMLGKLAHDFEIPDRPAPGTDYRAELEAWMRDSEKKSRKR